MPQMNCGSAIYKTKQRIGTAGCLVRFDEAPGRVFALTAAHVVADLESERGDQIYASDPSGAAFGSLYSWSTMDGSPTVDAALIEVAPTEVAPDIPGMGAPTGFNENPYVGQELRMVPGQSGIVSTTHIESIDAGSGVVLTWTGPDGDENARYAGQIYCVDDVTQEGDSGAVMLDSQGCVVGLVVGAIDADAFNDGKPRRTVVTPIAAIRSGSYWYGRTLQLVGAASADAPTPPPSAPLAPAAAGAPAGDGFGSLTPGGFFCATPFDLSIPRSIRTNNPGALNFSNWQTARPGYVGKTQPDGSSNHNVTTIYRTPEHGVASWYHLISRVYGFGGLASFTLLRLAQHYAGQDAGPGVDGYIAGWGRGSGGAFMPTTTFAPTDEQDMLALAKAMFFNEIGRVSPLGDDQITYALRHEQAGDLPR